MPNTMEHERYRFSTMSKDQLIQRLNKITDRQKLINFLECSEKLNHVDLYLLARKRYYALFGVPPTFYPFVSDKPLPSIPFSGISKSAGSVGSFSGAHNKPPIVIPKSNISSSLKGKKGEPKEEEEIVTDPYTGLPVKKKYLQKKKAETTKPVDIADVIYTKRKLRLD